MLETFYMVFFILCLWLGLSGCSSFSSFQTARTLPENTSRFQTGASFLFGNQENNALFDSANLMSGSSKLLGEIGGRAGILPYVDMGARLAFPGSVLFDVKYQFFDRGMWAIASGLGLGYTYLNHAPGSQTAEVSHCAEVVLPVYVSMDVLDWFGWYGVTKYHYRHQRGALRTDNRFINIGMGIRIGNTQGVMVEGSFIKQLAVGFYGFQVGVAFFWGDAPSAGYYVQRWQGEDLRPDDPVYYENPEDKKSARVMKTSSRARILLISHEALRAWKMGDRVCVFKNTTRIACGRVTESSSKGAVVRLGGRRGKILPGMLVKTKPE